ncbi:hypothetical protein [Clostridium polynesiense]|uniref:hypothetical protein n=1 Tax=Clostridium polynesiense TaxID=1325933 RepID=UPI0006948903|nr:hypothetical protein [Clostridium polynesiense]
MYFENLMALWIAVDKKCTPEVAFKWLDRYTGNEEFQKNPQFRWTVEDAKDVVSLRQQGCTWGEIKEIYGFSSNSAAQNTFNRIASKFNLLGGEEVGRA